MTSKNSKRMLKGKYRTDCLSQAVVDLSVNWSLIPVKDSHFCGLGDARVKLMKLHPIKTIGATANLYLDEVYTMLNFLLETTRSCLRWCDSHPLRPALLITGFHNHQLPLFVPPSQKDEKDPNKRFQYLQKRLAAFFKKWTTEYLSQLQSRSKNMAKKQKLTKGDLVYITDDNSPPLSWPLGIVRETNTSNDNLVRVAKFKAGDGKLSSRLIEKLRKIPFNTS